MKLTQTVIELMFELSSIESDQNAKYLHGEGNLLRNNLLELFKVTQNPTSHEIIIDIMSEAGYPWFGKLARSNNEAIREAVNLPTLNDSYGACGIMSEEEFMDLLPANGHLH